MAKIVTRYINRAVERELWARAAGRCQFGGCNRILYTSPVTKEQVNISEKAHIYSFSPGGARGQGPYANDKKGINNIDNLMLVCHDCHKKVDKEKDGGRYSADLLQSWKIEHERRVFVNTGVDPTRSSHVVLYGANIGEQKSFLQAEAAMFALFPDRYPAEELPIQMHMSWEGKDDQVEYWKTESENLRRTYERKILPLIENNNPGHFSVFGLAPIPLLILLGSLFTDKIQVSVHQLRREPEPSWKWADEGEKISVEIKVPSEKVFPPALIISLSAKVDHNRIRSVLGEKVTIWEVALERPHNDFLKVKAYLTQLRQSFREVVANIKAAHPSEKTLRIFPAMPVASAIEFGRIRMPKADQEWIIFDQNNKFGKFIETITIK